MSQITTHVLDTTRGKPAQGLPITLSAQTNEGWQELASGVTNADGRVIAVPLDTGARDERRTRHCFRTSQYAQEYHGNKPRLCSIDRHFLLSPNLSQRCDEICSSDGRSRHSLDSD